MFATLPATLAATDGQTLGYTWSGLVENWHQRAFTSFGDGHGVWEKGGGTMLPFYARNFRTSRSGRAVDPSQLMPTLRLQPSFTPFPTRRDDAAAGAAADRIQSHGLDLTGVLKPPAPASSGPPSRKATDRALEGR